MDIFVDKQREKSNYFEKSKRKDIDRCELCKQSFSLMRRTHKCKRCKRYVCGDCGSKKTFIIGIDHEKDKKHRTCDTCLEEIKYIEGFIKDNELKYTQSSKIAAQWITEEQVNHLKKKYGKDWEYEKYLEYFNNNESNYGADLDVIKKDVLDGRTNKIVYNYSIRQFLDMVQKGMDNKQITDAIMNVLQALVVIFPDYGYCQGMNMVVGYLLSFGNEREVFWTYVHIIDEILPKNFYKRSKGGMGMVGYLAEEHLILELLKSNIIDKYQHRQQMRYLESLRTKLPRFILNFMLDSLEIKCSFYLLNKMIVEKSFAEIELAILSACRLMVDKIGVEGYDSEQLSDYVVREVQQGFLHAMKSSLQEVDDQKRQQLIDDFYKDFAGQWTKNDTLVYHKLAQSTSFKKEQIQYLQEQFNILLKSCNKNEQQEVPGLNLFLFKQIVSDIIKASKKKQNIQIELNDEELEMMFNSFDEDRSGLIDFREFICIVSFILKGDMSVKIELLFKTFDIHQLGFLDELQFHGFLECLAKSLQSTIDTKIFINFQQNKEDFINRSMSIVQEKGNKVYLSDVVEIVMKDEFINQINSLFQNLDNKDQKKVNEAVKRASLTR